MPVTLNPGPSADTEKHNNSLQSHHIANGLPFKSQDGPADFSTASSVTGQRHQTANSTKVVALADGFPFFSSGNIDQPLRRNDSLGGLEARETMNATKKLDKSGTSTPPGRRSVQFARPEHMSNWSPRSGSFNEETGASGNERRGGSLFSKLRSFANSSANQSLSRGSFGASGDAIDERFPTSPSTPHSDLQQHHITESPQDESEIDADGEESAGEIRSGGSKSKKKRRATPRPWDSGIQTAPTTPKTTLRRNARPPMFNLNSINQKNNIPRSTSVRRATMIDRPGEDRQGVSEDEGRDRLARGSPWRRAGSWVNSPRGMSYGGIRKPNHDRPSESSRPGHFRRALTALGGSGDGTDGLSAPFSSWRHNGERNPSMSAAKWRRMKAGLKMLGQRRKAESTIDHAKSAELLAELTAGVPAALLLASMFQRDEHGNRRIPVLLEQLKVKLTDSRQTDPRLSDRHMIFRIELEYGNGLTRMKWVIHRALRDFANLHARYKLQIGTQKYIQLKGEDARTKLPRFPKSAFPYLRGIRGLESESEDEELDNENTGPSGGEASGTDRANRKKRRRPSISLMRHKSSGAIDPVTGDFVLGTAGTTSSLPTRKDLYAERQRRKLDYYLQKMIRYLIFRPESNRLCKFLELSALGIRLAAEGSYHGKEGVLIIQSGKGVDFRKAWTPSLIKGRHGPKWFLVRHSYIVCVDSPEEMNIYDVFLVDSDFRLQTKKNRLAMRTQRPKDFAKTAKDSTVNSQKHRLKLYNSERKIRLLAKNERQLLQFKESIQYMISTTPWSRKHRFDSFAPVRTNVFAQWLVDGRDYMWNVSRAINMAKDVVYIHDWWLSPELYMRRPAAISQKWRLDRLLQRKAREGVKIFVIMYRNINSAIPIDSEYSKFSLLDLHPNVFVQRSPNQIRQGTFFWAHHEKICVVDHMIAFVGGIDLCLGRWDTPQHSVVDDKLTGFEVSDTPKDADHCQLWPGKDYSNPRVQDFFALDKPYEEMYDRSKVPRMPWHDISMQVVGQPARDLTRHFVQRWNYILRQRRPTRPTPFLLPPPEFDPSELETLGLQGTCEVQILRSCCMWSMGTPDRTECSIMNAYTKMIQQSDHFVYVENQFFVSSCEVEGTKIENTIGEALVERIIRADQNHEDWRAILMIPLMPGFQNTVDSQDGTSIRLIMQCQFRSICRGEFSIFGRLRAEGIDPEEYIEYYSLRSWGKIGLAKELVTEQLYIHAKCMVVDDRIAIIGSANINERSMLGSRDSECAAVVRDTDMLSSTMNGKPYLVGKFPHTLRMRLMREHLGLDVDQIMEEERHVAEPPDSERESQMNDLYSDGPGAPTNGAGRHTKEQRIDPEYEIFDELTAKFEHAKSLDTNAGLIWDNAPHHNGERPQTVNSQSTGNTSDQTDFKTRSDDQIGIDEASRLRRLQDIDTLNTNAQATTLPILSISSTSPATNLGSIKSTVKFKDESLAESLPPYPTLTRLSTAQLGLTPISQLPALPKTDDTDIGGPPVQRISSQNHSPLVNLIIAEMKRPVVGRDCMRDPLNDSFAFDIWHTVAENNTKLFRTVFRCMPDSDVKTWREYKEYAAYMELFSQSQGGGKSKLRAQQDAPGSSGPPGTVGPKDKLRTIVPVAEGAGVISEKVKNKVSEQLLGRAPLANNDGNKPMGRVEEWAEDAERTHAAQTHDADRSPLNQNVSLNAKADNENLHDPPVESTRPHETNLVQESEKVSKIQTTSSTHGIEYSQPTKSHRRRRRGTTRGSQREFHASDDIIASSDAEELLSMVQGSLVLWPYDW